MKRMILLLAFLVPVTAVAQQPPEDDRVAAYRQLLLRANDELASTVAQANRLSTENAKLRGELEKAKAPADKKD
jgi:hypothetical protein